MPVYFIERYVPGITVEHVVAAADRALGAAAEMSRQGVDVAYLGSTFLPEEGAVFDTFGGASEDAVRQASERAGFVIARISRAILTLHPFVPRPWTPTRPATRGME
jgi:Nickel responsive protein SCO4226-like